MLSLFVEFKKKLFEKTRLDETCFVSSEPGRHDTPDSAS
jgi:hypothetical protein